jgi:hypothetical protein
MPADFAPKKASKEEKKSPVAVLQNRGSDELRDFLVHAKLPA